MLSQYQLENRDLVEAILAVMRDTIDLTMHQYPRTRSEDASMERRTQKRRLHQSQVGCQPNNVQTVDHHRCWQVHTQLVCICYIAAQCRNSQLQLQN
jgi:hypothetical protein